MRTATRMVRHYGNRHRLVRMEWLPRQSVEERAQGPGSNIAKKGLSRSASDVRSMMRRMQLLRGMSVETERGYDSGSRFPLPQITSLPHSTSGHNGGGLIYKGFTLETEVPGKFMFGNMVFLNFYLAVPHFPLGRFQTDAFVGRLPRPELLNCRRDR